MKTDLEWRRLKEEDVKDRNSWRRLQADPVRKHEGEEKEMLVT